jgi:hypothetical protein
MCKLLHTIARSLLRTGHLEPRSLLKTDLPTMEPQMHSIRLEKLTCYGKDRATVQIQLAQKSLPSEKQRFDYRYA